MASCWQVGRNSKKAKKPMENQGFLVSRPSNFEAKFNKKRPKTDQNSSKNLVSILIQFLMDFGSQLGSKILPKPGQNRGKSMKDGLPNQWKFCMLFERPFNGSWGQHGSKILPKWCPGGWWYCSLFSGLEGSWGGLGASWGPRGPKSWFNRFLVDFWWILVDFW